MKKYTILLTAILFLGIAVSANAFFGAADPVTTEAAANVKIPVYNNSGTALDEGDVVVWDIGSSTGDNDLYVTTTTTADTGLVAGVVASGGIASGASGSIIVYGFAQCDILNGIGASSPICTTATAGSGDACANAATAGNNSYAISSETAAATGEIDCFVTGQ